MSTIKNRLESKLMQLGMSLSQAQQVMDIHVREENKEDKTYGINYNDIDSSYPEEVYLALFMSVKITALDWINKNIPKAWFKPMFK